MPIYPLACIPLLLWIDKSLLYRTRRSAWYLAVVPLGAASLAITALGVLVPYEQFWNDVRQAPPGVIGVAADDAIRKNIKDATWRPSDSVLPGTVQLLDEARPFPLRNWSGSAAWKGALSLLAGAAAVTTVLAVGVAADRRRRDLAAPRRPKEGSGGGDGGADDVPRAPGGGDGTGRASTESGASVGDDGGSTVLHQRVLGVGLLDSGQ